MLLVDDDEREVRGLERLGERGVRGDDDARVAAGRERESTAAGGQFHAAGQQDDRHVPRVRVRRAVLFPTARPTVFHGMFHGRAPLGISVIGSGFGDLDQVGRVIDMFIIGKTTPKKEKLVQVARECLEIGMEAAKPFGFIGDIGHAIEKHAKKNGFSVVRDLCGHGVGVEFHEEPDVEHFGKKGTGMLLVPGMVFTIEPMINAGTWEVFIDEEDGWTVVTEDELPSAQWEHTFLMTENGLEILTH